MFGIQIHIFTINVHNYGHFYRKNLTTMFLNTKIKRKHNYQTSHDFLCDGECGEIIGTTAFVARCVVGYDHVYIGGGVCVGSQRLNLPFNTFNIQHEMVK